MKCPNPLLMVLRPQAGHTNESKIFFLKRSIKNIIFEGGKKPFQARHKTLKL